MGELKDWSWEALISPGCQREWERLETFWNSACGFLRERLHRRGDGSAFPRSEVFTAPHRHDSRLRKGQGWESRLNMSTLPVCFSLRLTLFLSLSVPLPISLFLFLSVHPSFSLFLCLFVHLHSTTLFLTVLLTLSLTLSLSQPFIQTLKNVELSSTVLHLNTQDIFSNGDNNNIGDIYRLINREVIH